VGCVYCFKMRKLNNRVNDNKKRREVKLKKQLELRKNHIRLQQIAKRLAAGAYTRPLLSST